MLALAVGATPMLSLGGCNSQPTGDSIAAKGQNVLIGSGVRQHYEIIDPQDGLFVSYWEKHYDVGSGQLDLFPGGFKAVVQYFDPCNANPMDPACVPPYPYPDNTNMVTGKGKRYCYGGIFDWDDINPDPQRTHLGLYGWWEDPLIEYYIGRPAQSGDIKAVSTAFPDGKYTTPQGEYTLYVQGFGRANLINPENDPALTQKFLMFNAEPSAGTPPASQGPVDLSAHFEKWPAIMDAFWAESASAPLRMNSYVWHHLVKANYCIVGGELYGNINASAEVHNISLAPHPTIPVTIDGICDGVSDDGDTAVDENFQPGFCILPPEAGILPPPGPGEHNCGDGTHYGTTSCSGGVETCVYDDAGAADVCDGIDNDCDGAFDENFFPATRNCGTEVGRCQNTETLICSGKAGEAWGTCEDGPDPIDEIPCNFIDDNCDGRVDENSILLPIRCVHDFDEDRIEDGPADGVDGELDSDLGTPSDAFAEPGFGSTSGEIITRGDQVVVIYDDPDAAKGVQIQTLPGGGGTPAEISLCGGTVDLTMGPGELQLVTCPATSCVFASEDLKIVDRGEAHADFYSGSFVLNYGAKVFGAGLSPGSGSLAGQAQITSGVTVGGVVTGNRAGAMPIVQGATVPPQALTTHTIDASGGMDANTADWTTTNIFPGNHGNVVIGYGTKLVFNGAGTYRFKSLRLKHDAKIDLGPAGLDPVTIALEGNLVLEDRVQKLGEAPLDVYSNGALVQVGYDTHVAMDIQAPVAFVEFKDRAHLYGCVGGRDVTIGSDAKIFGEASDPGDPDPPGPAILTGKVTKTNDWGGDYCMTIDVTNSGGTATAWRARINTNGSTIYNTWNATYSGTWGQVTATPNKSYNIVIDPGETDTTIGFCAHRWAPGQTATFVSVEAI